MQRQGGHNTTKAGGAGRRGLVLRFLGGCEGSELTEFIQLLTLPFHGILENDERKGESVDTIYCPPLLFLHLLFIFFNPSSVSVNHSLLPSLSPTLS